jgi:hypothetical protein
MKTPVSAINLLFVLNWAELDRLYFLILIYPFSFDLSFFMIFTVLLATVITIIHFYQLLALVLSVLISLELI